MFRRWLRHQDQLVRSEKLQVWGRSALGETAVLWGSFQDNLGNSYPVRYLLVRQNGSWRIDGFHLSEPVRESSEDNVRLLKI